MLATHHTSSSSGRVLTPDSGPPTQNFDRKARALGNAFAELTREQARALVQRFEGSFATDLGAEVSRAARGQERLFGFLLHCAQRHVWSTDSSAA